MSSVLDASSMSVTPLEKDDNVHFCPGIPNREVFHPLPSRLTGDVER